MSIFMAFGKMNLPFLGAYFPNLYFYSIEKGGEIIIMVDIIIAILKLMGCGGICYFIWLTYEFISIVLICRHNELSDKKVKYITQMFSKSKKF
jgi:hypothetical protein|nr:MAG TPA: hypothetical protein [Bacteriophage sp.]DAX07442.1 MAG TPA: hypothetical protein [Bacteriophage sp.]DAX09840.1 MAG TPA: hypothetical protein [Bacteriophage sp.]